MFRDLYRGRRVLVTGHTGFKGAWLSEWLLGLGADVGGYALAPATSPALFDQLGLARRMRHIIGDVRDAAHLGAVVREMKPEFVFHLAAQPLVRESYRDPVTTFATNAMGTVHLLEAVRNVGSECAVVVVTTDKCYENRETHHDYREEDPLGGHDPYSASKGAAEIIVGSYARSFFHGASPVRVASARAGNVIGGGDWATDRLVPDCMRALQGAQRIRVRNQGSTRPWQHVLEPLGGYLQLGAELQRGAAALRQPPVAFNFGPTPAATRSVRELVEEILRHWPGAWEDASDPRAPHEAALLSLSIEKAARDLGWRPVWDFAATIQHTVEWYRRSHERADFDPVALTRAQISRYVDLARAHGQDWAR